MPWPRERQRKRGCKCTTVPHRSSCKEMSQDVNEEFHRSTLSQPHNRSEMSNQGHRCDCALQGCDIWYGMDTGKRSYRAKILSMRELYRNRGWKSPTSPMIVGSLLRPAAAGEASASYERRYIQNQASCEEDFHQWGQG